MASITLTSDGKIVIKVGKESYTTNVTVGLDDNIASKINTAIGNVVAKLSRKNKKAQAEEVATLKKQASDLANQLYNMLKKKRKRHQRRKKEGRR
jgi:hypothetical protein